MGLSRSDALSIGRGVGAEAVQGIVTHITGTTPTEVIAGQTGKTLYLNYIILSTSELNINTFHKLTDGSGGTAFFFEELGNAVYGQGTNISMNFGEYGLALTEDNGLFVESSGVNTDLTVTALGCWR
ncbi:TPA: hypothetical protein EYO77_03360 [Candidatus Poribacteria bacterium]|nr:hypothetical protein [Candidatus Poribacteria bacterium]